MGCNHPFVSFIAIVLSLFLTIGCAEEDGKVDPIQSNDSPSATDSTEPHNTSILIDSGVGSTASQSVTLSLSALDDTGVTAYYTSETDTTPASDAGGWTAVASTTNYSNNVTFTLSSGDGVKTVYVWFKDAAGNVSASSQDSITLATGGGDSSPPTGPSIVIDGGAGSTSTTSVTLSLSASDDTGVTGYFVSESASAPSAGDGGWNSVSSTTSYADDISFTLSSGDGTKTVYVWFKDDAGNVSTSASDTIDLISAAAPTVLSTAPENDSASISIGTDIVITFDAVMNTSTITVNSSDATCSGSIQISADSFASCVQMNATVIPSNADSVFTVSPAADLDRSTTYKIKVTTSAESLSGTALASEFTSSTGFTTYPLLDLPDTGQISSHTGTYGEDHDYTRYEPSFTDNANGTVTDNITGLIWQQTDDTNFYNWSAAATYCSNLILGGSVDWRVPTYLELLSIVDYEDYGPTIDPIFSGTDPVVNQSVYWTATDSAGWSGAALRVDFYFGSSYAPAKTDSGHVRCVRDGVSISGSGDFIDNGNGTVTDNNTGLIWQQSDDDTARTWEAAITYCEGLILASQNDWRLPNIKEIGSIQDLTPKDTGAFPTLNPIFTGANNQAYYWTSTTYPNNPVQAFDLYTGAGTFSGGGKTSTNLVLCVRN